MGEEREGEAICEKIQGYTENIHNLSRIFVARDHHQSTSNNIYKCVVSVCTPHPHQINKSINNKFPLLLMTKICCESVDPCIRCEQRKFERERCSARMFVYTNNSVRTACHRTTDIPTKTTITMHLLASDIEI